MNLGETVSLVAGGLVAFATGYVALDKLLENARGRERRQLETRDAHAQVYGRPPAPGIDAIPSHQERINGLEGWRMHVDRWMDRHERDHRDRDTQ